MEAHKSVLEYLISNPNDDFVNESTELDIGQINRAQINRASQVNGR
jgi:hypothetical protein